MARHAVRDHRQHLPAGVVPHQRHAPAPDAAAVLLCPGRQRYRLVLPPQQISGRPMVPLHCRVGAKLVGAPGRCRIVLREHMVRAFRVAAGVEERGTVRIIYRMLHRLHVEVRVVRISAPLWSRRRRRRQARGRKGAGARQRAGEEAWVTRRRVAGRFAFDGTPRPCVVRARQEGRTDEHLRKQKRTTFGAPSPLVACLRPLLTPASAAIEPACMKQCG